jgi:hypothetical protein
MAPKRLPLFIWSFCNIRCGFGTLAASREEWRSKEGV